MNIFLRLSTMGILLILINAVWTYISVRKLTVNRNQRLKRMQVGHVFEEGFEIINPIRLSRLWVEVDDLSDLPGRSGSKVLSGIGGNKNRYYYARTILTRRGSFNLGPTKLRSGDPFGMFLSEKTIPNEKHLLVLPHIIKINKFYNPSGYIQGGKSIRQKSLEATSFASGVREYQSGDPLNRIHWKSSAKRNKFMVKEFDQDPQADIWIVIDGYEENNFEDIEKEETQFADTFWAIKKKSPFKLPKSTFEYAVSCAASLSSFYILEEKNVGLMCADNVLTVLPPEKGSRQEGKLLETMAFLQGKGSKQINEIIESSGNQIMRGSTVVIITSAPIPEIQLCIEILLRRRLKPIIIHINKESFMSSVEGTEKKQFSFNITGVLINYGDDISSSLESIVN
ncbi:MAG TPA: DUF58 domain-containing protein [Anaerolineaceae bacterium]|nr:DUF58 domain-containing protein [Anaerolineaceae bacterium]